MKKLIVIVLFCSGFTIVKAQQNNILQTKDAYPDQLNKSFVQSKTLLIGDNPFNENGPDKDYNYYNRKSRNQRITGLSLLGGGLVLSGIGVLLVTSSSQNYNNSGKDYTAVVLFGIGAAAGLASIPFMIMAHSSKNKARATLSTQKIFIPGKADKYITGLTVSIPIGK